jgi:hypothetical protein
MLETTGASGELGAKGESASVVDISYAMHAHYMYPLALLATAPEPAVYPIVIAQERIEEI